MPQNTIQPPASMQSLSPSIMSASSSDDDIEMANLEDTAVAPDPPLKHLISHNSHEQDSADEQGDEGDVSLLGSTQRTWVRERTQRRFLSGWHQVKGIVIESAPTLLLTTGGLLLTGELLDHVAHWKAMTTIDELIIIIPVILNLKGNLEMNLSARLGTAANVGELDDPETRGRIIFGNLSLLQVQATVVSFVAACVSLILGLFVPKLSSQSGSPPRPNLFSLVATTNTDLYRHRSRRPRPPLPTNDGRPKSGFSEFVMVASTAMAAACLSSILLGSFMCVLIVLCRRYRRDPGKSRVVTSIQGIDQNLDNIAPPIAACLGDLVTLCFVGAVSAALINFVNTPVPFILVLLVILSSLSCAVFTHRNPFVKDLIKQGWSPLFGAMVISSGSGIVLDIFASRYDGFPLLAMVISGLPGSVGSIFVSRLSTALHAAALLPSSNMSGFRGEDPSPKLVMITLLLVTIPVEVIFLATLHWLGWLRLPILFAIFSIIFFCSAVIISLFLARSLTNYLWSKKLDPDMYALPIHSALMDLVGQLLLVLCFELVLRIRGKSNG